MPAAFLKIIVLQVPKIENRRFLLGLIRTVDENIPVATKKKAEPLDQRRHLTLLKSILILVENIHL